jgi:hypothetical protein
VDDDFRDALAELVKSGARFLVVGAHALGVHGVPRSTVDLDVWIDGTPENARRVWQAFASFGVPLRTLGITEADFTDPNSIVQFGLPPHRIDVMTTISGVSFSEAWERRVESAPAGFRIPFIGREDFIRNKRASGRHKDLGDIEALEG